MSPPASERAELRRRNSLARKVRNSQESRQFHKSFMAATTDRKGARTRSFCAFCASSWLKLLSFDNSMTSSIPKNDPILKPHSWWNDGRSAIQHKATKLFTEGCGELPGALL